MKTTQILLEELRDKLANEQGKPVGKITNYAIAKHLNQTETTVARWAHGKGSFSDETCKHFANELGYDTGYIIACIHAEREKSDALKRVWERLATLSIGVTAILAGLAILPFVHGLALDNLSGPLGQLSSPVLLLGFVSQGRLYIMSNPEAVYWALLAAMALLAVFSFPLHNPGKKQKPIR